MRTPGGDPLAGRRQVLAQEQPTHRSLRLPVHSRRLRITLAAFAAFAALTGCQDFKTRNLAKSDTALVADAHIRQMQAHQEELLTKLYKRNPRELSKTPGQSIETRLASLRTEGPWSFEELGGAQKTEAMLLAFDPGFTGDRVFALAAGLRGMLHAAYGERAEFFLLQQLDEQALYNSARNLEILSWRLRHRQGPDGQVFLVTSGKDADSGELNLSFERIFGKMIALQDMMAMIAADRNNRTINFVARSVAGMLFLPIP